jgi:hypothetical protein
MPNPGQVYLTVGYQLGNRLALIMKPLVGNASYLVIQGKSVVGLGELTPVTNPLRLTQAEINRIFATS